MGSTTETGYSLKLLRKNELSLDELVYQSTRLVPFFADKQTRYKVSDLPNKRAIRFYIQKGLMDRPGRQGRTVLFSYRHLLQVLVIKKLQSEYLPLRKIGETTRTASDRQLETLLLAEAPKNCAHPMAVRGRPGASVMVKASPVCAPERSWTSCRKFKIHEHLELHVDEDFDLLHPSVDLDVINARIMNALSLLSLDGGGWNGYDEASPPSFERSGSPRSLPAPPVASLREAMVALITEGGLVPKGNPDHLESGRSTRFLRYSLAGIGDLEGDAFESVDLGWDTTWVNADPDRLLPLDAMRDLEADNLIGKMHPYFYTTTGVATTVDAARKIGRGIAAELKREGVSAAILTAT